MWTFFRKITKILNLSTGGVECNKVTRYHREPKPNLLLKKKKNSSDIDIGIHNTYVYV